LASRPRISYSPASAHLLHLRVESAQQKNPCPLRFQQKRPRNPQSLGIEAASASWRATTSAR
jgi:hypothetical protein